jgi:hypothetical protein
MIQKKMKAEENEGMMAMAGKRSTEGDGGEEQDV